MSHFTRIATQMVDAEVLDGALRDLGYTPERNAHVRGWLGQTTTADLVIPSGSSGYDIGFKRAGEAFEIVADWYGIRKVKRATFINDVAARYSYRATLDKLRDQGFEIAGEERERNGTVRLVLRRMA